ncbi:MAG: alanine dehydrogenase [Gammaproteobacteria bacterium]|nr:alanine dehydrogenase [Gammaproteobacteria bacterium]MBI5616123.1 alanine dehydrogenase [Gammaproteobacteria bacterium]
MKIGVPKEIKANEYRVGMTPGGVRELVSHGHQLVVETGAGHGINASDEHYRQAGAEIAASAAAVFAAAELIVKVKEPQPVECGMLRPGQVLFTYLHLAADAKLTHALAATGATGIAYETVTADDGSLPLLAPMSEVAGRLSIQAGARCLEREAGGAGMLLGGVPGVAPAEVLVIGGGVVGTNAIQMALGLEARVTVLDKSLPRLRDLEARFGGQLNTIFATRDALEHHLARADLVVGAVLVPGAAAPKLISRELLKRMKPRSVIVDVAIDQGGCAETSRPTTHAEPTFVVDDVVHYCVANMPGAVPRTSTYALTNATLPYVLRIADLGAVRAMADDRHLRNGLNVYDGKITHEVVAAAVGAQYAPIELVRSAA